LLAEDRMVVMPDRIGYGDSDAAPRRLNFTEFAKATMDGLDALGLSEFDTAGIHSGGIEAVELAVQQPSRVRRIATIAAPVFNDEERPAFKEMFGAPPEFADDGSHMEFAWGWWHGAQPEGFDLEIVHTWLVDHLKAWPNYWWTFVEAIDYPMGERIAAVTQPLLLMVPHDDIYEQTSRAISWLPEGAEVVDLPNMTNVMEILTTNVEESAQHLKRFFA
jgi:pimeloyl-ACP methyl ester carboxylesterase